MNYTTRSSTSSLPSSRANMIRSNGSTVNNIDYEKSSSFCSFKLIHEVKKHEQLYNASAEGYNDHAAKELIWEKINQVLVPNFRLLPESTQNVIRQTVRRKWKSLRSTMTKSIRDRMKNKNYIQRSETLPELQFLIPHINSVYAKFAQRQNSENTSLNQSEDATMLNDTEELERNEDDFIDLTDCDEKLFLKMDHSFEADNETAPDSTLNNIEHESYRSRYSATNCSTGEFASPLPYTNQEMYETHIAEPATQTQQREHQQAENSCQRATNGESEFQEKLLEALSNSVHRKDNPIERDTEDEDRMFLLSLVSDLRSVPVAKKMRVKAEIVTAIARGQQ